MKKLLVLSAALAALGAIVAGSAFAAPPLPTTCNGRMIDQGPATINGAFDVPADSECWFSGTVNGNTTVEGRLHVFGSVFNGNVTVTGGVFTSSNYGTWIHGNLTITGSNGDVGNSEMNGFWSEYSDSHIDGNVNLSNNVLPLYFQGPYQTLIKGAIRFTAPAGALPKGDAPVQHAIY
jgi:hypothetical protein